MVDAAKESIANSFVTTAALGCDRLLFGFPAIHFTSKILGVFTINKKGKLALEKIILKFKCIGAFAMNASHIFDAADVRPNGCSQRIKIVSVVRPIRSVKPDKVYSVNAPAVFMIVIKCNLEFDQTENYNATRHANSERKYFSYRTDPMLQDISE